MQLYEIVILQKDEDGKYNKILKSPYWDLAEDEQNARDKALLSYNEELRKQSGAEIDLERLAILVRPFE